MLCHRGARVACVFGRGQTPVRGRQRALCSGCCRCSSRVFSSFALFLPVAPMRLLPTARGSVCRPLRCSGREDSFMLLALHSPEAGSARERHPTPGWLLTTTDRCSSISNTLALSSELRLRCLYSSPCRTPPNRPSVAHSPPTFPPSSASTGCPRYTFQ